MKAPRIPQVEGEDFYRDKGRKVMTATYHLKRGRCCGHKCRHCPFKHITNKSRYQSVKTTILFSDVLSANGYKYSIEALQDLKVDLDHQVSNNIAFGSLGDKDVTEKLTGIPQVLNLRNAAFRVENPSIEGNELKVNIVPIDTPAGERLRKIIDHVSFRPVGHGVIVNGEVKSYSFSYVAAIPKDTDSFREHIETVSQKSV